MNPEKLSNSSQIFSNKLRVRVNGIIVRDRSILMVEIQSLSEKSTFWMPPGGGVNFGESLTEAVKREVFEETGLNVGVKQMLYVSEYLKHSWHAVEFYFLCTEKGGIAKLGSDPELLADQQILKNIAWIKEQDLSRLNVFPPFLRKDFKKLILGVDLPLQFVTQ